MEDGQRKNMKNFFLVIFNFIKDFNFLERIGKKSKISYKLGMELKLDPMLKSFFWDLKNSFPIKKSQINSSNKTTVKIHWWIKVLMILLKMTIHILLVKCNLIIYIVLKFRAKRRNSIFGTLWLIKKMLTN